MTEKAGMTARRISWIVFSAIVIFCGLAIILAGLVSPFVRMLSLQENGASVGIIGGAEGATSQYLILQYLIKNFEDTVGQILRFGILVIVTGIAFLVFNKFFSKHCGIFTSLISFALSVIIASGLGCVFLFATCSFLSNSGKHPIRYPVSLVLGIVCFFAMLAVLLAYALLRSKNRSAKGIIIDVVLTVIYTAPLWTFFLHSYGVGSEIIKRLCNL